VWSAAEELDGDGGELVVELENAAVAGVGILLAVMAKRQG